MAINVAPHAGAWIETLKGLAMKKIIKVAPHAGAWIETNPAIPCAPLLASPLTQGRGLKLLARK
tara:strand:- start:2151 stop:2342 length:192 start_codon:yes stop_codon:yes gene_type:complete